jgi:hypothetical protein
LLFVVKRFSKKFQGWAGLFLIELILCMILIPLSCPIGSSCTDTFGPMGADNDMGGFWGNPLGAVCVIPTCAVAAFAHHAI